MVIKLSLHCQRIVTTLPPPGYNLVDKLTGVGLSEVDCISFMMVALSKISRTAELQHNSFQIIILMKSAFF